LPDTSKAKLLSQNAFYVKGIQIDKNKEWKLAIYLHQIVRLTMTLWSTDAKGDGSLQGKLDTKSFLMNQTFARNLNFGRQFNHKSKLRSKVRNSGKFEIFG